MLINGLNTRYITQNVAVTLHVRVWIEIIHFEKRARIYPVTLHVRVWIEMMNEIVTDGMPSCHPPREGVD